MNWLTSNAGILCTFLVLGAILCALLIGSGSRWKVKAPLILIVPLLAFLVVRSIEAHQGWPLSAYPPNGSIVVGDYVQEPNPATGDPGTVYIMAFPPGSTRPREYHVPYTRQTEHALQQGRKIRKQGGVSVYQKLGWKVKLYRLPPKGLPSKNRGN